MNYDINALRKEVLDFQEAMKAQISEACRLRWVSVKEDVPQEGSMVLVFSSARPYGTMTGYIEEDLSWHYLIPSESRGGEIPLVTHWMPLPKPPEE